MKAVIDPVKLVDLLIKQVREQTANFKGSKENTFWTLQVKLALSRIGNEHGVRSIYTDRDRHMSEFMLDLVWWQEKFFDGKKRQSCALAMECEWRDVRHVPDAKQYAAAVVVDFEKILSIKAPLKLMVFSSHETDGLPSDTADASDLILRELSETLLEFEQLEEGETYVFVDFRDSKKKDDPDRAYIVTIGPDRFAPAFPKAIKYPNYGAS